MSQVTTYSARAETPEQTDALAAALARALKPGDGLLLMGELGAGKTHFVRGVALALGARQEVTSPTFGLVNIYESPRGPIVHADAYRLKDVEEFRRLALDDYLEQGIGLIEWGERVERDFPGYHRLAITADESARHFVLRASAPIETGLTGWRQGAAS
jgi:tRNA threonylcarbamoyladenosine biosynthesis protein TsaE